MTNCIHIKYQGNNDIKSHLPASIMLPHGVYRSCNLATYPSIIRYALGGILVRNTPHKGTKDNVTIRW
jgi:hypothetical protein